MDCSETFAFVFKFTSIRILMPIGERNDIVLHRMDVVTAYLNGEFKEELNMENEIDLKGETQLILFVGFCDHYLGRSKHRDTGR